MNPSPIKVTVSLPNLVLPTGWKRIKIGLHDGLFTVSVIFQLAIVGALILLGVATFHHFSILRIVITLMLLSPLLALAIACWRVSLRDIDRIAYSDWRQGEVYKVLKDARVFLCSRSWPITELDFVRGDVLQLGINTEYGPDTIMCRS
jgi:hypothetical protein